MGTDCQKCIDSNAVNNSRVVVAENGRFGCAGDLKVYKPLPENDLTDGDDIVKADYSGLADDYAYQSGC